MSDRIRNTVSIVLLTCICIAVYWYARVHWEEFRALQVVSWFHVSAVDRIGDV